MEDGFVMEAAGAFGLEGSAQQGTDVGTPKPKDRVFVVILVVEKASLVWCLADLPTALVLLLQWTWAGPWRKPRRLDTAGKRDPSLKGRCIDYYD